MKFRRRPAPLLLLLLPSLASVLVVAAREDSHAVEPPVPSSTVDLSKSRFEVGTKDAPVDGKDGKPHAGPWVGKDNNKALNDAEKDSSKDDKPEVIVIDGEKIPQSNDGVMDDPSREKPIKGTTGTEGGVSERNKAQKAQEGQTGEKVEKKPESPKGPPPLPHSEQIKTGNEKMKATVDKDDDDGDGLAGLEKPDDLPKTPNKSGSETSKPGLTEEEGNDGLIQPLHSYVLSLTMILFSEIGDKTFLVAALMAMKHDRLLVFSAAFTALITMTVLSAVLGHTVPTLLPKRFTNFLAAALFLIFGGRLLKEGLAMDPGEGVAAEMKEVEMELEEKEQQARQQGRRRSSISPYALEMGLGRTSSRKSRSGSRIPSPPRSPSSSPDRPQTPPRSAVKGVLGGLNNLLSLLLSPAWVQTFIMTFLGEWGDRSQIATIAMAAGQDYWWVTGGAISGHAVCTGIAVIGGRAIAGRVSLRVVTLGGAIAFLIFGVIYLAEALYFS
ncbi:uncharacterized protein L3040_006132 [Drepanopeziza brunnea f. sp. 'multigermtubi']|uniref:uncharacterized protein n=1 Tax=Drepanopeziza brunnea f. sp. 'multigermtubi' TaxID=698441 RepID=UPI002382DEF8|nr:hypothetical protein L3040_006132 [Drepanopeziza brunnea f. sp. 'multigermtubi']